MKINKDIFPIVKGLVDKYDFLSLLKTGAPKDEYDEESRKIAGGIRNCDDVTDIQQLIYNVFYTSFGEDMAGEKDWYLKISQEIFDAIKINE